MAAARQPVSAQRGAHPRPGPADADRLRLLPRLRAARAPALAAQGRPPRRARGRRAAGARAPDAGAGAVRVARGDDPARRPGLRRRGLSGRARVHPLPPRPRGAAGGDRGRLRGVHAPVLGVVGRALHALAALDRALVDDLRRPRRPRRLEHVQDLGHRHPRPGLVGRPHRRRLHVVLDLPAPRQPLAARARRLRRLPPRAGSRGRQRDPQRLRLQGRPRGRGHALELLPRHRLGAAGHGRLARGPRARPRQAQHGRRGRVATGSRSRRAATASTC